MHAYLRSLALGLALLLPAVPAFAADAPAKTDAAIPDKPTRITERNTPVAVEYEGNDSIGSRLATRVKETLNSSNLFSLTDKDRPKSVSSSPPSLNSDRPGVGRPMRCLGLLPVGEHPAPLSDLRSRRRHAG
ncbi:MAG: hypothetical protein ACLUDQ_06190 [Bilophila wadsworthia]